MISLQVFLLGLLVVSTLTGLTTEALKKIFDENHFAYRSNTLAGVVATLLSLLIGVSYVEFASIGLSTQTVICLVALIFMSWLCSMVGYDKVIQAISQFKTNGKG